MKWNKNNKVKKINMIMNYNIRIKHNGFLDL